MNVEFLLQAIGRLDDDLIADALQPCSASPSPLSHLRRWASIAACLVLLLTASYVATHLDGSGSASTSASAGDAAPSTGTTSPPNGAAGGSASSSAASTEEGSIFLDNAVYQLTGETLTTLPDDAISLGKLSQLYPDAPSPSTDLQDYVGLPLFQSADGRQLYVQRDDGLWAVAAMAEP